MYWRSNTLLRRANSRSRHLPSDCSNPATRLAITYPDANAELKSSTATRPFAITSTAPLKPTPGLRYVRSANSEVSGTPGTTLPAGTTAVLAPVTGLQNAASGAQLRNASSNCALSQVNATWVPKPRPRSLSSISSTPLREVSLAFWYDARPPVLRAMTISSDVRIANAAKLIRVDSPSIALAPTSTWLLIAGCSAKLRPLLPSGR